MNINFELYKVFYHAAKELSFTRAAEALFVTQSSISQSIKQLESHLEVLLFIRNKRNMQLTKEGEILYFHISEAFDVIKAGERNIENTKAFDYGQVNIGASDTICRYFLLEHIQHFHREYPKIRINITNQPSKKTLEDIAIGKMDFGIVNLPDSVKIKEIAITEIGRFQEVAITTEEFLEKIPENPSLHDLSKLPLIMLNRSTHTRQYLDALFSTQKISISPEFELESIDLIIDFVRIGLGVGFVMADAIPGNSHDIHIINLRQPLPSRSICIISNQNCPMSVPASHFISELRTSSG